MDKFEILRYGGIAVLVVLFVIFELTDRRLGRQTKGLRGGYEHYTPDGNRVMIRHVFGASFKVYVFNDCPIPTKHDRLNVFLSLAKTLRS